jgi:putative FmdB family regulatory protein
MPIYEYQCGDCGHKLETLQRISDDPLRDCPSCGAGALQKLISRVGFRLKGTGWYETDFKDKPKSAKREEEKSEGKTKPQSDDSKSSEKKAGTNGGSNGKSTTGSDSGK